MVILARQISALRLLLFWRLEMARVGFCTGLALLMSSCMAWSFCAWRRASAMMRAKRSLRGFHLSSLECLFWETTSCSRIDDVKDMLEKGGILEAGLGRDIKEVKLQLLKFWVVAVRRRLSSVGWRRRRVDGMELSTCAAFYSGGTQFDSSQRA